MGTIYKLIIEDDEGKTTVYPLSYGEISIGRKDGNTIRLMERNVSRRHARLLRSNGSVFIEDLDSYNGIRINGERINGRYEVKEGDLVEIGDYHLALQAAEVQEEVRKDSSRADTVASGESMAGTLPDFRLPEEILAGMRASGPQARSAAPSRDTLVDQPAAGLSAPPALALAKAAGAPTGGARDGLAGARSDEPARSLPPFPMSGGLLGGQSPLTPRALTESELRTREMKPVGQRREGESSGVGAQAPARVAAVARLICVSTDYAGREFVLSRPEQVIGRVEDNDIVIEHRSVSRNHAKIAFDGRAYKIIDLQSANGILVNGEEYAMTDLRKGDLIELGHVRFRFIPAGEPFVPSEEEIAEMRQAGIVLSALEPVVAAASPARASEAASAHSAREAQPPPLRMAPMKRDLAGDVPPGFDLSSAATVTDAPISALSSNGISPPEVQAATTTTPAVLVQEKRPEPPSRRAEAVHDSRNGRAEPASSRAPTASIDQRPTEVSATARTSGPNASLSVPKQVSANPSTAGLSSSEPRSTSVELEGLVEPRTKSRAMLVVAAALLLAGAGFLALRFMDGGANELDRTIKALYDAGRYAEVREYYDAHVREFGDLGGAAKVYADAGDRLQEAKKKKLPSERDKSSPTPQPALVDPSAQPDPGQTDPGTNERLAKDPTGATAPSKEPKTNEAEVAADPSAGLPEGDDPASSDRGRRRVLPRKKTKEVEESAKKLCMNGRFDQAVAEIGTCGSVECIRLLVVAYAGLKDLDKMNESFGLLRRLGSGEAVKLVEKIVAEANANP